VSLSGPEVDNGTRELISIETLVEIGKPQSSTSAAEAAADEDDEEDDELLVFVSA
jgi:hypothetical protein